MNEYLVKIHYGRQVFKIKVNAATFDEAFQKADDIGFEKYGRRHTSATTTLIENG